MSKILQTPEAAARLVSAALLAGGWILGTTCFATPTAAQTSEPAPLAVAALAPPAWDPDAYLAEQTAPPRHWNRRPPPATVVHRTWNRGPTGWFTLHGGFFDDDGVPENDWLVGFKATHVVSRGLDIGLASDYQRRSNSVYGRVDSYRDPAGNLVTTTVTNFQSSSSLIPILGVMELKIPLPSLQPYAGVGGGYEILVVDGTDYNTHLYYSDTYGGWGWQAYAGAGILFSPRTKLVGEAFWNDSHVNHDFYDPLANVNVRQEITVHGVGFRGGLAFGL